MYIKLHDKSMTESVNFDNDIDKYITNYFSFQRPGVILMYS